MIKIAFYQDGLIVSGHANYNNSGKDIICAGVSSIVMGSLNWFDKNDQIIVLDESIKLKIHPNNVKKESKLLKLLEKQLLAMNHSQYSQYLEFKFYKSRIKDIEKE